MQKMRNLSKMGLFFPNAKFSVGRGLFQHKVYFKDSQILQIDKIESKLIVQFLVCVISIELAMITAIGKFKSAFSQTFFNGKDTKICF